MRKILLMATLLAGSFAVNAQDKKPDELIKVSSEKYDFGTIKQNVPVTTTFYVTNVSDKTVVIENAWGACGCTTPEVPKEPIAPGSTVKLKVAYNEAALAHFEKDVFIKLAGVNDTKIIKITGDVLEPTSYDTDLAAKKFTPKANHDQKPAVVVKPKSTQAAAKIKTKNGDKKTKVKTGRP